MRGDYLAQTVRRVNVKVEVIGIDTLFGKLLPEIPLRKTMSERVPDQPVKSLVHPCFLCFLICHLCV